MTHCFTLLSVSAVCNSTTHLALLLKEKFGQALNTEGSFTECACVSVFACMHVSYPARVRYRACLQLIWWAGPSHHFEVTAKWPLALGSGHLANSFCVCVFVLQCPINTKWYSAGAHQRWPSQLTEMVIYSFTEHSPPVYAHTITQNLQKRTPSPLSSSSGFLVLPVLSLRAPAPRFQSPWTASSADPSWAGNLPTGQKEEKSGERVGG